MGKHNSDFGLGFCQKSFRGSATFSLRPLYACMYVMGNKMKSATLKGWRSSVGNQEPEIWISKQLT